MKKMVNLGRSLSKAEQKKISGGYGSNTCNAYCGSGSGVTCASPCPTCDDAGNGQNPDVKGGDKLCV